MKLVLDFVFNHCGKRCKLVQDRWICLKMDQCVHRCVVCNCLALQDALADKSSPKRKYFFMGDEYKPHGYKAP